ncbi:MAG: helix-turn-helix domain-containing protein [Anaerocolumna sp.]
MREGDILHQKIKELCKQKQISINRLEQDLGLSKGYVCKLNNSSPSVENAKKIADYLGVPIEELIKEEVKTG